MSNFNFSFTGSAVTEYIFPPDLEEYISSLVGTIECGDKVYDSDEPLINLEKRRVKVIGDWIRRCIIQFYLNTDFAPTDIQLLDFEIKLNKLVVQRLSTFPIDTGEDLARIVEGKSLEMARALMKRVRARNIFFKEQIERLVAARNEDIEKLKVAMKELKETGQIVNGNSGYFIQKKPNLQRTV